MDYYRSWKCKKCGDEDIYHFRDKCPTCNEPKPKTQHAHRGIKGGYMRGENDWDCPNPKCNLKNIKPQFTYCGRCGYDRKTGKILEDVPLPMLKGWTCTKLIPTCVEPVECRYNNWPYSRRGNNPVCCRCFKPQGDDTPCRKCGSLRPLICPHGPK